MCVQVHAGEEIVIELVNTGFLVRTSGGKTDAAACDLADGDATKSVQLMVKGYRKH